MQCPRLDHFVRFNTNGTIGRCGHMVSPPRFKSFADMNDSQWLKNIKQSFVDDTFPKECVRCKETEQINGSSIRLNAIEFHKKQTREDYLIVGGVLDNVCNSACLTCNANHSTKIGSLMAHTGKYYTIDNSENFWNLPLDRVVHLDISGGEPSASKNYRDILKNIPPSVRSVRINTNCSSIIPEIESLLERGIHVTVTASLDGIGEIHDLVRWPIKWDKFYTNLMTYKNMGIQDLNTWTTVSALNIGDFDNILSFVKDHNLAHSYALLHNPEVLSIKYSNSWTRAHKQVLPGQVATGPDNQSQIDEFVFEQKHLRGML